MTVEGFFSIKYGYFTSGRQSMAPTRRTSHLALHAYCGMALISIGLSACNPMRLGATLRAGFGRPGETTSSSLTLPSNVTILIEEAPFDTTSHTVKGCGTSMSAGTKSCLIAGQPVFGSADQLPKTYVIGITASFAGRDYKLDVSQMYDAWGRRPLEVNGVRYFGGSCADARDCTLRGLFSDAAGAYVAEWQIVGGVSVRTVLTDSGDVVAAFRQHIDPPK
jgi:hypothetical protein